MCKLVKNYINKIFKSITDKPNSASDSIEMQEIKPLQYDYYKINKLKSFKDPNIKIYKYFPLKYLLDSLENERLLINKVNKWQDCYENFLFKQQAVVSEKNVDWITYTDCIYGQCWTLNKDSDAMWRIYSKVPNSIEDIDDVAIRVETTIKKLWDTIYVSDDCMANTFIGKVVYMDDNQLNNWLKNHSTINISQLNDTFNESLCIKRLPFSHENEIRIIVMKEHSGQSIHPDFIGYKIMPTQLFSEFVIEPRIKNKDILYAIEYMLNKYNIPVRQSKLYQMQHNTLINIG